jgi:lysophospholipase L1-like esterase
MKRLSLAALGLLLAFAVLEVALRLTLTPEDVRRLTSPESPMEAARWADHPFLPFVGKPETTYTFDVPIEGVRNVVEVRNNAFGFRSHELPAEKKPSDYFVVAFGESTTWGAIAQTNAQTWPELLEAKLQARYPDRNVRVFNFGTQNATAAYSLVTLSLIGVHIHPDLVIAYHGFNEIGPALAPDYRSDHAHFFRNLALAHQWHGYQMSLPRSWLASYAVTYVTALLDERIGAHRLGFYVSWPIENPDDDEDPEPALERSFEHLRTMAAVARGYGAAALFSTFQFYDGDDPLNRAYNVLLRKFFAENDFAYVDLDGELPDYDRSLQFDECHFTHVGRERVAESFYAKIVAEGFLERH